MVDCSAALARLVFQVATMNKRFLSGYAWFVTEDVKRGQRRTSETDDPLADYPVGLVAVAASRRRLRPTTLMRNTVRLIGRGLRRYQRRISAPAGALDRRRASSTALESFNSGSGCWSDGTRPYFAYGELLYRYAAVLFSSVSASKFWKCRAV